MRICSYPQKIYETAGDRTAWFCNHVPSASARKVQQKKIAPLQKGFYSRTKRKASKLYRLFSFQPTAFTALFFSLTHGRSAAGNGVHERKITPAPPLTARPASRWKRRLAGCSRPCRPARPAARPPDRGPCSAWTAWCAAQPQLD